jgi:hypothetical protein
MPWSSGRLVCSLLGQGSWSTELRKVAETLTLAPGQADRDLNITAAE